MTKKRMSDAAAFERARELVDGLKQTYSPSETLAILLLAVVATIKLTDGDEDGTVTALRKMFRDVCIATVQ